MKSIGKLYLIWVNFTYSDKFAFKTIKYLKIKTLQKKKKKRLINEINY